MINSVDEITRKVAGKRPSRSASEAVKRLNASKVGKRVRLNGSTPGTKLDDSPREAYAKRFGPTERINQGPFDARMRSSVQMLLEESRQDIVEVRGTCDEVERKRQELISKIEEVEIDQEVNARILNDKQTKHSRLLEMYEGLLSAGVIEDIPEMEKYRLA